MTAKEALFVEMGWAEDAKDAPGQMPLPGFPQTWGQKSKGRKKGIGAAAVGGGIGASSPSGTPQGDLETHDKKNHPNGYKGGRCKLRAELAAKGFDVRGYDAKVHNFTAPEGYDYNEEKKGDEKEEGVEEGATGEQGGEEPKPEENTNVLPKPEKVDVGGVEVVVKTEKDKEAAEVEKEFTTFQKKKQAEQQALEKSVETIRDEVIEARERETLSVKKLMR